MPPASQFKFACPVCGQHLQATAAEAGHQTECPSCFKKLIVPQAPTEAGGKLLISAALADTRRVPANADQSPSSTTETLSHPETGKPVGRSVVVVGIALIVLSAFVVGLFWIGAGRGRGNGHELDLWTDRPEALRLVQAPAIGRLNGWSFEPTHAIWRDTGLTLKQEGGHPDSLAMVVTFPLRGGELVPGKTFRVDPSTPPLDTPIVMTWEDELGTTHAQSIPSGYVLWVEFDAVSTDRVAGRLHICLPDPAQSWVAGSFDAENKTRRRH